MKIFTRVSNRSSCHLYPLLRTLATFAPSQRFLLPCLGTPSQKTSRVWGSSSVSFAPSCVLWWKKLPEARAQIAWASFWLWKFLFDSRATFSPQRGETLRRGCRVTSGLGLDFKRSQILRRCKAGPTSVQWLIKRVSRRKVEVWDQASGTAWCAPKKSLHPRNLH